MSVNYTVRCCVLLMMALIAMAWVSAIAAPSPIKIEGLYHNLQYIRAEGDTVGLSLRIVQCPNNDHTMQYLAVVQYAEGVLSSPQLVRVGVDNDEIELSYDYLDKVYVLSGNITSTGIHYETHIKGVKDAVNVITESGFLPRHSEVWDKDKGQ